MLRSFRQALQGMRQRPGRTLLMLVLLAVLSLGGLGAGWYWRANSHFQAGKTALERRDFAGARDHLTLCLKAWPYSAEAHFLAARTARRLHLYDEAEVHLKSCQERGWPPDRLKLERRLISAQGGDLSKESELWSLIKENDPDSVQILEVLIQEYVRTGRFDVAMRGFELLLERQPDDIEALLGRAWVWEQRFEYANAVADYRRAVQLEPENDQARLRLAQTLVITGPASEALVHFERLHQEQPDDPDLLLGLARCRRQLGQAEAAKQLLASLLAKHPTNANALNERGKVALDEGKFEEAEPWLRKAAEQAPFDRQANYNLSQCLKKLHRDTEARRYEEKVALIDKDFKRLDELTKQVMRSPNDPALRYEAGVIFLSNGEEKKALRWLNLALEIDPWHRPTHQKLAEYYERIGQREKASHHRLLARQSHEP